MTRSPLRFGLIAACCLGLLSATTLTACNTTSGAGSGGGIAGAADHGLAIGDAAVGVATIAVPAAEAAGLLTGANATNAEAWLKDLQDAVSAAHAADILGQAGTVDDKVKAATDLAAKIASLLAQIHAQHSQLDQKVQQLRLSVRANDQRLALLRSPIAAGDVVLRAPPS